jgi:pimeloyl-ACP methyl ester carboxylesterase
MKYFVAPGEHRRLDAAARTNSRGAFIELSDGVTHYELTGPNGGELVVLVGGLTVPLFYWDMLAAELHTQDLRTLAYSGYGRGYSDRIQADYDEALFVRQLAELMRKFAPNGRVHMIGTSMGALISMAYACRLPAALSTMTLVGPAGLRSAIASPHRLLRNERLAGFVARRFGRRLLESHLAHNVRDGHRAAELAAMTRDAYRFEGSMYALFATLQSFPLFDRAPLYRQTRALGVPTMLVWGADDDVTPVDQVGRAGALLQAVRYHIIDDCGHMAPFEHPSNVAETFASFLDSHAERSNS